MDYWLCLFHYPTHMYCGFPKIDKKYFLWSISTWTLTKIKNKVFLSLAHTAPWDSCLHLSAFFMSPFMKQILNNSNMAAARAIRAAWNMSSLRGTNHLIIQKCNIKDVLSCLFRFFFQETISSRCLWGQEWELPVPSMLLRSCRIPSQPKVKCSNQAISVKKQLNVLIGHVVFVSS